MSIYIAADDWVAVNGIRPAVASMSLGGGASQASDDGVMGMINAGVQVAVAAGNEDTYACTKSPARTIAVSIFQNLGHMVTSYTWLHRTHGYTVHRV